jgi:hypothetical protein
MPLARGCFHGKFYTLSTQLGLCDGRTVSLWRVEFEGFERFGSRFNGRSGVNIQILVYGMPLLIGDHLGADTSFVH